MAQPIQNAKDQSISTGTLPNVSGALLDYFQPLTFSVVTKSVVNFQEVETSITTNTMGVRQPFTAQQLLLKPEGQRAWKWETIHALPSLILKVDDVVVFKNENYRVMRKMDWSEYGYVQYEICQDYK